MATITIKRPHRATNRFRNYKIFLDGKLLGTLGNGETKAFITDAAGTHQLQATIDWCSSPVFSTAITADENKKLAVDLNPVSTKNWSYFFYSGFCILILDFILNKTLHFPYALILMVFPFLYMIYTLILERKKQLIITEIQTVNQED
ncbi:hypothetical protein [Flavobacterium sp. HSC-61S13]|uniref:hypothetical protein n=1 Tax=Flavobacterium sp. HSC-61S13 TaxID=2910963 RepID=UPI0020A0D699|nr:hypothetical protein [Flavobacterium sp. HSC-61S13]MCP1997378.1 hypothetical protein [Flavobacterium sp. HSC-61S13]